MYGVVLSKAAARTLQQLPRNTADLILRKLDELAVDPVRMRIVKALTGIKAFRLRIGDWRVVYTIERAALQVIVVRIAGRGDVYR